MHSSKSYRGEHSTVGFLACFSRQLVRSRASSIFSVEASPSQLDCRFDIARAMQSLPFEKVSRCVAESELVEQVPFT